MNFLRCSQSVRTLFSLHFCSAFVWVRGFVQILRDTWPRGHVREGVCLITAKFKICHDREEQTADSFKCVRFWQFQSCIFCYLNQLFDPVSRFWFDPHSRAVLWTCLSVSLSRWSLGRRDVSHRDFYPAVLALHFDWGHTTSPDPSHRRRWAGASRKYSLILSYSKSGKHTHTHVYTNHTYIYMYFKVFRSVRSPCTLWARVQALNPRKGLMALY